MSTGTTKAPNLPIAPSQYSPQYMDQFANVLRLYFAQLDNAGPSVMSTERTERGGGQIIAALNFSQPNRFTNVRELSLPTQADLADLRVGDVYVDTSAGNVLKVKP
jgi:hypothetical protein